MILQYFKKKENIEKLFAQDLYKDIIKKSNSIIKNNNFFTNKNYGTSFEVVSILLIFYINNNISLKIKNYKIINEELISIFISDLDESLREKGIGDMSIGKYVKSYVKKFYFRLSKFPKKNEDINYDSLKIYLKNLDFIKEFEIESASNMFITTFNDYLIKYKQLQKNTLNT